MTHVKLIRRTRMVGGKDAEYFSVQWRDTDGHPREKGIGRSKQSGGDVTLVAARKRCEEIEGELEAGSIPRDRLTSALTLGDLVKTYAARRHAALLGVVGGHRKNSAPLQASTTKEHTTVLRYLALHVGPDKLVSKIDDQDAEAFIACLLYTSPSPRDRS